MTTNNITLTKEQFCRLNYFAAQCVSIDLVTLAHLAKSSDKELPAGETIFFDLEVGHILSWLRENDAEFEVHEGSLEVENFDKAVEDWPKWLEKVIRTVCFWRGLK